MSRRSTGHLEFAPVAGAEARQLANAGSENMTTIFISRRPIHDRSSMMSGYQLLYDRDALTRALSAMDQKAGSEFYLNTVLKWGMEPLGNGTPAFIGITRTVLLQNYCTSLPKDRVVLEIPGDVEPDDAVIRFLLSYGRQVTTSRSMTSISQQKPGGYSMSRTTSRFALTGSAGPKLPNNSHSSSSRR